MAGEDYIVAFVAEFSGCPRERIDADDLIGSCGLDGDDAFELIEAYGARFGVDLMGYVWEFHHEDEAALTAPNPLVRSPHGRVGRIPLTATMLAGFAQRGCWDLDYPEHQPTRYRRDLWLSPYMIATTVVLLAVVGFLIWGKAAGAGG